MKLKLIFLSVIMGFALNVFSDDISNGIVCSGDSCEQKTCVPKLVSRQHHAPSRLSISDFGPSHEVGYYINAQVINKSTHGKVTFAHDFNSIATGDLSVFEFGPGCSQQVMFKIGSISTSSFYFYEIIPHDTSTKLEANFWKGLDTSHLSTRDEPFSKNETTDLGADKGQVCSQVSGSYDEETQIYSLKVVLEDCL